MLRILKDLARETKGATAIEYAIIASVVSVAALGAFIAVGAESNEQFENVASKYSDVQ